MADLITIGARLEEVETALHQLAMGKQVVEVARDGRRVVYGKANVGDLTAYRDALRKEYSETEIMLSGGRRRRQGIGVIFGG